MSALVSDNALDKFTTFGDLLRYLRRRAGITQMELSIAVGYSDAQISRLEQNLRLPDLPTIEARFISALEIENEPKIVAKMLELAASVRREDAPIAGLCPYKGLSYFDEMDTELFVGRESITTKLTERVLSLAGSDSRFLAVVGTSGSGKSSIIRAGLVPALCWNIKSASWYIQTLTPTAHPMESLATSLTRESNSISAITSLMDDLLRDPRSLQVYARRLLVAEKKSHIVFVVDQFEELFALCRSEEERSAFIGNLLTAANEADGRVIVIITLRADFYAHCANYIPLREALVQNQEYIGAMRNDELRRAIEEPARRGRWELEAGLVDLLLHEVGQEPGALPLLSHALLETWQRRRGRTMTLSGYASSGGVHGAIAKTAEALFTDQFTQEQQAIARRIFLRLTEFSHESPTAYTRRRVTFDELVLKPEDAAVTRAVLKVLTDARLITTGENYAEVAHEALIREWPTLRSWLEDNHEGLRLHRHLTESAQEWAAMSREPDMLYRGARLLQVYEWANEHSDEINLLEREFINISIEQSEQEARARETQRQRELIAAQTLVETQQRRIAEQTNFAHAMQLRARYLAIAFTISIIMASFALFFSNQSDQYALAASDARATAAVNAVNSAKLFNAMIGKDLLSLNGLTASKSLIAYSPDGQLVAARSKDTEIIIWSRSGNQLFTLTGHTDRISKISFSPDGTQLASSSLDGTAILWDMANGKPLFILKGHSGAVECIVFSPDGKYVATCSDDKTSIIWDTATGSQVLILEGDSAMRDAVYSPDGKHIATANMDGSASIWDVVSGIELRTLRGHAGAVTSVAFSPDGKWLASVSVDGTAIVWNAVTGDMIYDLSP